MGKTIKVEFVGQIANMLILPTPTEAGRMAKHQIAVNGVAGARKPIKSLIVPIEL